jgi:ABC-type nitrate/sulfonate/bicarbonate transport system permease component
MLQIYSLVPELCTLMTSVLNKKAKGRITSLFGIAATIGIWWILAATVFASVGRRPDGSGGAIPTPPAVVEQLIEDGFTFYFRNGSITVLEAALGFLWGNAIALVLAAIALTIPKLDSLASQMAIITYLIPIVAIGPIVRLIVGAPGPGEPAGAAVVLAAMSVLFTTYIGAVTGVKSTDKRILDVVSAYGGSTLDRLFKVQLLSALPSLFAAFKIAAPAAFLGAILGEYVGGTDVGFGPAMVNAQQSLEVARVWGVALVSGALAGAGYWIFGIIGKLITPWANDQVVK